MRMASKMKPEDFLMFEGNQWALYKVDTDHFSSWIYHCCNPMAAKFTGNRFLTWSELHLYPGAAHCWKCQQLVPEKLLGLWRMHNFDSMADDRTGWKDWTQLKEYNIEQVYG